VVAVLRGVNTWRRPYRDPFRIVTGGIAAGGSVFLSVLIASLVGRASGISALDLLAVGGFAALWLTFAWRLHRTALVVSAHGVRIRWLLLTRTVPWLSIKDFRTRQDRSSRRLVVVLRDNSTLRTPIQRAPRGLHLSTIHDGGTSLRPDHYDRLLTELNSHGAVESK
jgi:hypothetical protein